MVPEPEKVKRIQDESHVLRCEGETEEGEAELECEQRGLVPAGVGKKQAR